MDTFRCNLLMMVAVTMRVDPLQQGYCRSAGSVGFTAYEELVALRSLHSIHCCAGLDDDHVTEVYCVDHRCWIGGFCCAEVSTDDVGTASADTCTKDGDDVSSQSDNEGAGMPNPMHAPFSNAYLCTGKTPVRCLYGVDIEKVEPPSRTVGGKEYTYIVKVICDEEFRGSTAWDVANIDVTFVWNPTLPTELYFTTFGFPMRAGSVRFVGFETVTSLEEEFCCECAPVHFPDLSSFVNVTTIGRAFFADSGVTAIDFTPMINVTSIGEYFMTHCEDLEIVNFSGFRNVKNIGPHFLVGCMALKSLHLGGVGGIMSIDDDATQHPNFNYYGTKVDFVVNITLALTDPGGVAALSPLLELLLVDRVVYNVRTPEYDDDDDVDGNYFEKIVDLTPLRNVTKIKSSFLNECDTVVLDTSMLNLQRIGENFASECEYLESIDLSGLRAITTIQPLFLHGAVSLDYIDLSPLSQVTTIEHDCFAECLSLTALDLSCMSMLESIGCGFAASCESLTSLTLPRPSRVHTLGPQFAIGCTSLKSVDISGMDCLTMISDHFLADCSALTSLKCDGCVGMTSIGSYFMSGCTSLQSLDLSGMSVTTLGSDFAADCSGLTSVNLSGLSSCTVIEERFMMGCSSLVSVDLSPLSRVTEINSDFMACCTSLTNIDISMLRTLNVSVPDRFLDGCSSLGTVDLSNLTISAAKHQQLRMEAEREAEREEQERIDRYRAEQLIADQKKIAHQQQLAEEKKIAHQQKLQRRIAHQQRMAEQKKIAHQQQLAKEKRIAHQQRMAEEKKIAHQQKLQKRVAHQQRMVEQERAASERKKSSRR